jgi:outer membrane protein assembly factor BamB
VGDATYVATDEGTVVALDGDGHETWTVQVEGDGFLEAPPDHGEVVLFDDAAHRRVTALASKDGAELWSVDGDVQWFEDDRAYLWADGGLVARDLDSGDRLWSVSADEIGVGEAGLYVIEGDQLLRVDPADGETAWSVDHGVRDVEMAGIAVAGDFVAVGGERATAYDATDGDPLWSSDRDDSPVVQVFAQDLVTVQHVAAAGGDTEVQVYDRDGPQGSIDGTRFGFVVPFRSGSDQYAFDFASGDLYGADHQVIETYDGSPGLAAEGLYVLRDGAVSYYEWGAPEPRWTLDEDLSDEASMQTGEGRLLVADHDRLSSYS